MKSYTFQCFTGENMVNNSSMFKHPTALTNISTQTFLFNQRPYKKGIRQIKMAKAAIVSGPRRRLAVNFFLLTLFVLIYVKFVYWIINYSVAKS